MFGWAKPVPVNLMNLRNPKRDHALVAAAGPLSNLILALGFTALFHMARFTIPDGPSPSPSGIITLAFYGVIINLLLALFNLIPIPPLDGSSVLTYFLPNSALPLMEKIRPFGFLILLLLLYTGGLSLLIGFVAGPIFSILGL